MTHNGPDDPYDGDMTIIRLRALTQDQGETIKRQNGEIVALMGQVEKLTAELAEARKELYCSEQDAKGLLFHLKTKVQDAIEERDEARELADERLQTIAEQSEKLHEAWTLADERATALKPPQSGKFAVVP